MFCQLLVNFGIEISPFVNLFKSMFLIELFYDSSELDAHGQCTMCWPKTAVLLTLGTLIH